MCNIFDVAKYILSEIGEVSTMKLQKLCYYSLAESLAADKDAPLFNNKFEAWANGPVCRDLWNVHKGSFYINKSMISDSLLSSKEIPLPKKKFINIAIDKYGSLTGWQLSEKTHKEAPWIETIGNTASVKNTSRIIPNKRIAEYYSPIS